MCISQGSISSKIAAPAPLPLAYGRKYKKRRKKKDKRDNWDSKMVKMRAK
jgi:hypothetical protein